MRRNIGTMAKKGYKSKTAPETWESRYTTASGNQAKMFKRFSNWYDSLYAIVGVTPSPWRSKMYVPVLARQTWALVAKFLAIKPNFEVRTTSDDDGEDDIDDKAEKAARKIEFDYENPYLSESMRDKLFAPLLDATVTGTGMAKVVWKVENKVTYSRVIGEDETVDLSKEKKTTKKIAYNDLEPINIFNVFVSPSATNLYDAPWIIIKEFKTVDELKAVNAAHGVEIYKNLDQLTGGSQFDDDFASYNYSRNRLLNNEDRTDSSLKMVKIYECYEGDTICTYAEGESDESKSWLLIREQKNPYWHGKYPLVKFHVKGKPFQFWGEGLFETTYRLQAGYNDAFNHFMDQWNLHENSMLMIPETAHVNEYIVEPGGVITYRGDQPPQQFKHEAPNGSMLQELLGLMDQAIEGVTISNYASGIPNSDSDKTKGTATGILHLQDAAGDLVSFMRNNFSQSVVQIGRMWLSNNQQYLEKPVKITANVKGRKQVITVTPQDLQGDMELTVDEASMDPANKDQRIQRFNVYLQQLQGMQAASLQQAQESKWTTTPLYLDYNALVQDYSELMDHAQYGNILLDEQQVQQAMQASQSPSVMPNERIQLVATDLMPSEMAQLLQRNGIQPDPSREQGAPTDSSLVARGNAALSQAKAEAQGQVTPSDMLKAQAQAHQQALDTTKLGLDAQKQSQESQPAVDPSADQATVDMTHQLVQGGHLHPDILQHLPGVKPSSPGLLQKVKGALGGNNG